MENNTHHLSQRITSISPPSEDKHQETIDGNLSPDSAKLDQAPARATAKNDVQGEGAIREEEEEQEAAAAAIPEETDPGTIYEDIDRLLGVLLSADVGGDPPELPESTIDKFVALSKREIVKFESAGDKGSALPPLVKAIERLSKLSAAAASFQSTPKYGDVKNRSSGVLHHVTSLLEEEFHSLLGDPKSKQDDDGLRSMSKRQLQPLAFSHDPCASPSESNSGECPQAYPPEIVERLHVVADAMIAGGHQTECCQVFAVDRRNVLQAKLSGLGFETVGVEDVVRMMSEHLENDISTWMNAFKHTVKIFSAEKELCEAVFAGHAAVADRLFREFAHNALSQFLAFADGTAMSKRSIDKLMKVLDMYDALSDAMATIDALLPGEAADGTEDPRKEISNVQHRLGEAAVDIFCDLESSIKADCCKSPIRGGEIHPVTRYVVKYLQVAAKYKDTMDQLFKEHKASEKESSSQETESGAGGNPFADQLEELMNLLDSNLDISSKLYKDPALRDIFLMNNGRYIAKQVKGTPEIRQLLGETWYRQHSSELQKYHKNYQRETWSRVLACLRDEGLQNHRGSVLKPVLKERLKTFNALIDEIHKTQSAWVVSDVQMQTELRVSVSAVVVPAYRSFVGRFSQYFSAGRQTEKYIKYSPEYVEDMIEDLFDGKPCIASATKKRT